MIDLILAFLFGWLWGSKVNNSQQKIDDKDCPLNIDVEGQSFGYLKNKNEDLR